ncbi:MAG TPA: aspartyl/asparaginyl beta-hydroxylase domain-containing protein [Pseudonocardiaceae bacterium]|jgi:hypothetical protein
MPALPDTIKLLPSFDADRLRADLAAVEKRFSVHVNPVADHAEEQDAGGWDVLMLRCPGGDPDSAEAGGMADFADTPYLETTPYVREIIDSLGVPVRGVRFSSLAAGASVREHVDKPYGLPVGWVRLHAPVRSNDRAILTVNGEENSWKPGEFWYANFGMPHSLYNEGAEARVHLIIDCYVAPKVLELFPPEVRERIDTDEVMFFGEEQPLPAELAELSGAIVLPPTFLRPYPEVPTAQEWHAEGEADVEGKLRVQDGRLVLKLGDHETALAHLGGGEFRPLCWTAEQTLTIESRDGAYRIVFRYRAGDYTVETERKQPELTS